MRSRYGLPVYPLVALAVLAVVDQFQTYAFTVLTPDISRALGLSLGVIAGVIALKTLAILVAPLPIAWLSQARSRRALLCVATGLAWSVMTLFTGFVTSLIALILVLVVDGLTTGSVIALHQPLLMDTYPPEARVRALSFYRSAYYLGNVGSPLLVALLASVAGLKRHEAAVRRDHGIGSLPALVIVEVREAREIFSAAVEAELPYINVAVAALSAEPFTLTIAFDCGVETVRENSFRLIVSAWSFREVGDLSRREINSHHRGAFVRPHLFIAGEGHLAVVVIEVLRFEDAVAVFALINSLLVHEPGRTA